MSAGTVPGTAAGTRLRTALDRLAPSLGTVSARLWSAGAGAERYRSWLRATHQIVRATEPLIAEAIQECLRRNDPISGSLVPYLAAHLPEERGHDRWLLADYAATGADPAELLGSVPDGAVARFAGAPGYWIRQVHPLGLLGHIALLEWYPPPPGTAAALARRTGLPPSAFRALREHSELDTAHGDRLRVFLDSLDLDPAGHRLLLTAATTSATGLVEVVDSVLAAERTIERTTEQTAQRTTTAPYRAQATVPTETPTEEPWLTWTG